MLYSFCCLQPAGTAPLLTLADTLSSVTPFITVAHDSRVSGFNISAANGNGTSAFGFGSFANTVTLSDMVVQGYSHLLKAEGVSDVLTLTRVQASCLGTCITYHTDSTHITMNHVSLLAEHGSVVEGVSGNVGYFTFRDSSLVAAAAVMLLGGPSNFYMTFEGTNNLHTTSTTDSGLDLTFLHFQNTGDVSITNGIVALNLNMNSSGTITVPQAPGTCLQVKRKTRIADLAGFRCVANLMHATYAGPKTAISLGDSLEPFHGIPQHTARFFFGNSTHSSRGTAIEVNDLSKMGQIDWTLTGSIDASEAEAAVFAGHFLGSSSIAILDLSIYNTSFAGIDWMLMAASRRSSTHTKAAVQA